MATPNVVIAAPPSLARRARRAATLGGAAILDQLFISGSNFVLSALLARWLTAEQYGAYALAFSGFILLSLAHQALILEPAVVLGPSLYRQATRSYLKQLLRVHWVVAGGASLVLLLGAAGVSLFSGSGVLASALLGAGLCTPLVLLFWVARRACYVNFSPLHSAAGAVLYSVFAVGGAYLLARTGLIGPFAAFLVLGVASLIVAAVQLSRMRLGGAVVPAIPIAEVAHEHWIYGRWALVTCILTWIPWNVYYLVLTSAEGIRTAADLRALMNFVTPVQQSQAALGLLLVPYTTRLVATTGTGSVRRTTLLTSALLFGGTAAYWLAVLSFPGEATSLLYGDRYGNVTAWLPFIAVSSSVWAVTHGITISFRALRRPKLMVLIYCGSAAITLVAGIAATMRYGITGAVSTNVFGSLLALSIAVFLLRRELSRPGATAISLTNVHADLNSNSTGE